MEHPYKSGYSLLPQLRKIDGDIFKITPDTPRFLFEKSMANMYGDRFIEHNMTQEISDAAAKFILDNYPIKLKEPHNLANIATQIQEDFAVHRLSDSYDWLAASYICLPSSWAPEEKMGKSFDEIHKIIPGMSLKNSRKILEAVIYQGPFQRFVWGLIYENELNYHPSIKRKPFNPDEPLFFVKVEKQMMIGLPEHKSLLFVLRQHLIPESETDIPLLHKALIGMTKEQKAYKGISEVFIDYLGSKSNIN